MISGRLRNALNIFALILMIGGPLIALIALGMGLGPDGARVGRHLGGALELASKALFAGGVLRLLVSIDARLEAKG